MWFVGKSESESDKHALSNKRDYSNSVTPKTPKKDLKTPKSYGPKYMFYSVGTEALIRKIDVRFRVSDLPKNTRS